jgi:hypothetical protein
MPLHLVGDELRAGVAQAGVPHPIAAAPADAAPAAAAPQATAPAGTFAWAAVEPLSQRGDAPLAELDELLGDYTGLPAEEVGRQRAEQARQAREAERAAASAPKLTASTPVTELDTSRTWMLWWIPTVLVPLLGGVLAWFVLRDRRYRAARAMFVVGIGIGMITSVVFLRFAPQIAVFTNGLSSNTKVTAPASTTKNPGGDTGSGTLGTGSSSAVQ